jgi:hypothetical protein
MAKRLNEAQLNSPRFISKEELRNYQLKTIDDWIFRFGTGGDTSVVNTGVSTAKPKHVVELSMSPASSSSTVAAVALPMTNSPRFISKEELKTYKLKTIDYDTLGFGPRRDSSVVNKGISTAEPKYVVKPSLATPPSTITVTAPSSSTIEDDEMADVVTLQMTLTTKASFWKTNTRATMISPTKRTTRTAILSLAQYKMRRRASP